MLPAASACRIFSSSSLGCPSLRPTSVWSSSFATGSSKRPWHGSTPARILSWWYPPDPQPHIQERNHRRAPVPQVHPRQRQERLPPCALSSISPAPLQGPGGRRASGACRATRQPPRGRRRRGRPGAGGGVLHTLGPTGLRFTTDRTWQEATGVLQLPSRAASSRSSTSRQTSIGWAPASSCALIRKAGVP